MPLLDGVDVLDMKVSFMKKYLVSYLQDALRAIKGGRIPPPGTMPSFDEMKEILGFNTYYDEEKRYATSITQPSSPRGWLVLVYLCMVC